MRMEGKSVAITGAAQGIGEGIARRLAGEGAAVTIVDINGSLAAEVAADITGGGGRAIGVAADVTDREQVGAALDAAVEAFGSLDVMFNNAGFNRPMQFLDVTRENWDAIMTVNGWGVLMGTQEAVRRMIAQGTGGKIINTASMAGRQAFPPVAPYCASKFAVIALTQAAARAFAGHDITVNGFAPGVVETPLWEKLDLDLMEIGESERPGQAIEDFSASIIRGRKATPDDIVGTALFLASSDSDYMTGQIVMIDGGMALV